MDYHWKKMKNKALFLDRDGVINIDYGYVHTPEKFQFVDGIFEFIHYFQSRNYLIFVITNQSGIERGYYSQEDFFRVTRFMESEFQKRGIAITKIYYCPCLQCDCRKPNPKMILEAKKEFGIELSQSILVGDKITDIEAGKSAGVGQNFLFSKETTFQDILNSLKKGSNVHFSR